MLLLLSERKVCLSETEQPGSRKRGSVNCGGGTLIAAVAIYVSGKVPTCVAEYWVTWRFRWALLSDTVGRLSSDTLTTLGSEIRLTGDGLCAPLPTLL
jgi:hypothetical protein